MSRQSGARKAWAGGACARRRSESGEGSPQAQTCGQLLDLTFGAALAMAEGGETVAGATGMGVKDTARAQKNAEETATAAAAAAAECDEAAATAAAAGAASAGEEECEGGWGGLLLRAEQTLSVLKSGITSAAGDDIGMGERWRSNSRWWRVGRGGSHGRLRLTSVTRGGLWCCRDA